MHHWDGETDESIGFWIQRAIKSILLDKVRPQNYVAKTFRSDRMEYNPFASHAMATG